MRDITVARSGWLGVLCLIGLDYFSTLAYLPAIAFESAGRLAPLATVFLVLVTLLGALPIYVYVAGRSPDGQGAVGLIERLIHGWRGKTFVLILLGFIATDFVITKTLSAANAAEHIIANPSWQGAVSFLTDCRDAIRPLFSSPWWQRALDYLDKQLVVTVILLVLSFSFWAILRQGFTRRVIQLAVLVVAVYLTLNAVVIGSALHYLKTHPEIFRAWYGNISQGAWSFKEEPTGGGGFWAAMSLCFLAFPSLAIGLSGFELSMIVMPLLRGDSMEDPRYPRLRVLNARKVLLAAGFLMSVYLLGSVLATATLIPPGALSTGGSASHRALAYLAHGGALESGGTALDINPLFGETFGTIYDLSTVLILCLAGASVTLGLRGLVPQYLSRLGMELKWAHNLGAILHLFNAINLLVIIVFRASLEAQRGAYVTSVVVLLSSAALATALDLRRQGKNVWRRLFWPFPLGLILAVFLVTAGVSMLKNPNGLIIAMSFVLAIVVTSLFSRVVRSTELRFQGFEFEDEASQALWEKLRGLWFPILVPHRPGRRSLISKEEDIRRVHRLGPEIPVVFVEAELGDASDFFQRPRLEARQEEGRIVLRVTRCVSIAHVIAAVGLELSKTDHLPEIHFGWSDEGSVAANLKFLIFGEGNIPWLVRELIRRAEPDPKRQPRIIVG
jgi:hypothetical protein